MKSRCRETQTSNSRRRVECVYRIFCMLSDTSFTLQHIMLGAAYTGEATPVVQTNPRHRGVVYHRVAHRLRHTERKGVRSYWSALSALWGVNASLRLPATGWIQLGH